MEDAIRDYLCRERSFPEDTRVSFLAAGEYNENFLVEAGGKRRVFRVNRGSQLGIDNQIEYEYAVLKAVAPSGVTPKPLWCDRSPEAIGGGVLLMEFLPGRHLSYRGQGILAADVFAAVHSVDAGPDNRWAGRLLRQERPISDIALESLGLIRRFPDHPMKREKDILLRYHERISRLADEKEHLFSEGPQCIVNTEVNSNNFLVDGRKVRLVDWEKAVISTPFQDLGHFLVETSTRWKGDYVFSPEEKREFLARYTAGQKTGSDRNVDFDRAVTLTEIMERTILLRALSWCFMAWYEYNRSGRTLRNRKTEEKIETYLKEIEWFLK